MIIDFHVHVLPPEDIKDFTATQFHKNIGAAHRQSPTTIENDTTGWKPPIQPVPRW